jgi:hypothetical protein
MQAHNLPELLPEEERTGTERNIATAANEPTLDQAYHRFRMLEYANGRGTGGTQFERVEKLFNAKQKLLKVIKEDCS